MPHYSHESFLVTKMKASFIETRARFWSHLKRRTCMRTRSKLFLELLCTRRSAIYCQGVKHRLHSMYNSKSSNFYNVKMRLRRDPGRCFAFLWRCVGIGVRRRGPTLFTADLKVRVCLLFDRQFVHEKERDPQKEQHRTNQQDTPA